MSYGPSGTQKLNSRKELPNHVRNLLWVGKVESGLQRIFQKALCLRKNPLVASVGLHLRPKLRKMNPPKERWAIFLKGKVISIGDRKIEGI